MPIFKPVNNKPQHTFTWLKVLGSFILLEIIFLSLSINIIDSLRYPSIIIFFIGIPALVGLVIGLILNSLTKFKWPILIYIAGYLLSTFICIAILFTQFNDSPFVHLSPYENTPPTLDFSTDAADTTSSFQGDEKHAIEEVLYLMEQQYPLGAYLLDDITTKPGDGGIVCTIVFTLPEEGNRKYISRYIVKEGIPKPVYIKSDTTSRAYLEYKLDKTVN